jgi:CSLREA domain-containing protein
MMVTTSEDELNEDGDCSLREAIRAANLHAPVDACRRDDGSEDGSEPDEILVPAGLYTLTIAGPGEDNAASGDLDLTSTVTITGAGAADTIIDGGALDRVFHVDPSGAMITASISGVTVQNGATHVIAFVEATGGGILLGSTAIAGDPIIPSGTLTLSNCVIQGNFSQGAGGGLANKSGTLVLIGSRVSDNRNGDPGRGGGGGIVNRLIGKTTLIDTTVSDNSADAGGGIALSGGELIVSNSTISGNTATGLGGGIARNHGVLTMTNSTISGNTAGDGGGIWSDPSDNGANSLNNCTVANNRSLGFVTFGASGGGIANGGPLTLSNTLVAGNTSPAGASDCVGGLTSAGYNFIQVSTVPCAIGGDPTGNIIGQDPLLGMLVDNGGLTRTHALLAGSPALNAGKAAQPGGGGSACAATDQRGFIRPRGSACDIGAFEATGGFFVSGVRPNRGGNSGSAAAIIFGTGFDRAATVKLARMGQADIVAQAAAFGGDSVISATFDLAGKVLGRWDVIVTNPDGMPAILPGGFTIEETQAPQLYVQMIGRSGVRRGLAERYFVVFGNRGNIDAHGVPLTLSVPGDEILQIEFEIAPPPPHPNQVPTDWIHVPIDVVADVAEGADISIPLFLPLIPAGYTGALHFLLTTPLTAPDSNTAEINVGIDSPFFKAELDAQVVASLVEAARVYAEENLGVVVPAALTPDLERYLTTQLESMMQQGRQTWVNTVGTHPGVFSLSQLVIDAAQFGAAQTTPVSPSVAAPSRDGSGWIGYIHQLFASLLGPRTANAECLQCGGADGTACVLCRAGTACSPNNDPSCPNRTPARRPTPSPTPKKPKCPPPLVPHFHRCVPRKCLKQPVFPGGLSPSDPDCDKLPRRRRRSGDPNDKSGRQGVAAAQFVPAGVPFGYVTHFENEATATAPAREVVVTDQLDVGALDLNTFTLGVMSFGMATAPAPAGSTTFSGGIDLRPEQNLLVLLDANLDQDTGLVTWRFHAVDAVTLQLPDDPLAGFLPPNVHPPVGEGSVQFTVQPKPGLPTGTQICNQARIVFDVNDPIDTAPYCNTIDNSPPQSRVLPLPATQLDPDVQLQWDGSDEGAGVATYTVYVSANGGVFTPLVSDTTDTAATFTGRVGESYAFCSIATDLVGNVEPKPCPPNADTGIAIGPPPPPTPLPACVGDCNGDTSVTVDELVRGVNIALGTLRLHVCPSFDRSGDTAVTVDELVHAVAAALNGCGSADGV